MEGNQLGNKTSALQCWVGASAVCEIRAANNDSAAKKEYSVSVTVSSALIRPETSFREMTVLPLSQFDTVILLECLLSRKSLKPRGAISRYPRL